MMSIRMTENRGLTSILLCAKFLGSDGRAMEEFEMVRYQEMEEQVTGGSYQSLSLLGRDDDADHVIT